MRTSPVTSGCLVALLLSILPGACGDDSPSAPSPVPSPATPITVGLELSGPEVVPVGGSEQFRAIEHLANGPSRDVTNEAVWRGGNSGILTVSNTGLASGHQPGETSLTVSYIGRTATRSRVFVLPPGTYKVSGMVTDEGTPVPGARVTVTAGASRGLSTTTLPDGYYRLYGVAGPTELRVTRTGYLDETRQLEVGRHETADFSLRLAAPRTMIAGTYALRVSAAADCSSLPDDIRTRTFTAAIQQAGPTVTVTLSGSTFQTGGGRVLNTFPGTVEPTGITFQVTGPYVYYYWYISYPSVLEQLTATVGYSFSGSVSATSSGSRISGTFEGFVGTYDPTLKPLVVCHSGRHQFVLSK